MRATVRKDVTERTIDVDVSGVPDTDVTRTWHSRDRVIRPDHARIRVVDGEVIWVEVRGYLILKSGEPSIETRGDTNWVKGWKNDIDTAPEWVQTIIREAPNGVTAWRE